MSKYVSQLKVWIIPVSSKLKYEKFLLLNQEQEQEKEQEKEPLPTATSAPLPGHADRHHVVLAPCHHRLLGILSKLPGILSRLSVILFLIFFLQLDEAFHHRSGGQHRLR